MPTHRLSLVTRAAMLLAASACIPLGAAAQQVRKPPARTPVEVPAVTVSARQSGPAEVTVTWTRVPGARGYHIGRLAPPNGWQRVNVPLSTTNQYVDRNVEAGRVYMYQIAPVLANGTAPRRFTSDSVHVEEGVVASGPEPETEIVPPETREAMIERVYRAARTRFSWWVDSERLGRKFWLETAAVSGFDEATLTARWREIAVAAQLYQHIFKRAPTATELGRQLASQRAGTSYEDQWRHLAQSGARDREHGAWAPSPMTLDQARGTFGWRANRAGEQCFGGLGPGCTGTIPAVFDWVQPRWHDYFRLPDGTRMAYVEIGVAVGSIVHDNACMDAPGGAGVACSGYVAIADLSKHSGLPAAMEWNKAAWNVIDHRGWRHVFGPYPVDEAKRRRWYDDLRVVVPARRAFMAHAVGPLTTPFQDQPYRGVERKQSRVLAAPRGTTLDGGDGAYCQDRRGFKYTEAPLGKAPSGICW